MCSGALRALRALLAGGSGPERARSALSHPPRFADEEVLGTKGVRKGGGRRVADVKEVIELQKVFLQQHQLESIYNIREFII